MSGGTTPTPELDALMVEAKVLAKRYKNLTGRPLGITGEVGEYEVARLLKVQLADVRQAGYDLVRQSTEGPEYLQVKARCVEHITAFGRLGSIDIDKEWHAVVLILMDMDFEPLAIYEADREAVVAAILKPGSKSRNERHALSISQFRGIARLLWRTPDGLS